MSSRKRRNRVPLWRDPRLFFGCIGAGLVLGATCPVWPLSAQPVCRSLAMDLKTLGLGQLGLHHTAPSSAHDGGTP